MTDITIKEVVSRRDLRDFIYLPEKIHSNDPRWLPPIYSDEWKMFNKNSYKAYNYADAILLLAYNGKKPVGRIMGVINRRYNEINKEYHGRFCYLECYDDQDVSHALISKVEDWARENGMTHLVGPLGFSDKNPQGFLIEGFEYPPFMTSANNASYMVTHIENEGYNKKVDIVNYLGDIPKEFPLVYQRVLKKMESSESFTIKEFSKKSELKPYIIPALELMNDTFSEIYAFVPLTDKEKAELAAEYLPLLDPKYIKMVENNGELVGFAIGMPDLSDGIKACNGRLFPFGILKVLKAAKQSKKLLMMLGGIKKEFRGKGIDVLMGIKILKSAIDNNMESVDSHLVLENNLRMRGEYERIGCKVVKKFRIYQKEL